LATISVVLAVGASFNWPKPHELDVVYSLDGLHSFDVTSCSKPKLHALHVIELVLPKPHSFDVSPSCSDDLIWSTSSPT
jgi:hypothetical protein